MRTAQEAALGVVTNDLDQGNNGLDPNSLVITVPPLYADFGPSPTGDQIYGPHNGHIDYQPIPGYVGPDSFEYEICDFAGLCDTATVMILVTPTGP